MLKEVDIKSGRLTYGQRIELGKILGSKDSEVEMFEKALKCMYDIDVKPKHYKKYLGVFQNIVDGIVHWVKLESENLRYDPTPEEKRAGIEKLANDIGEFGTVKALASRFNVDPDEIFKWQYGKVYGILATDLKEYKYQTKLNNIINEKYK